MITICILLALAGAASSPADRKRDEAVAKAEEQIEKGKPEEAQKTMQKLVKDLPTPESYLALARIQARMGELDQALASASKAVELSAKASPDARAEALANLSS